MNNRKILIFNIQKFSLNDGPGIRTVVFFKGCPLRCRWCSNPESQSMANTGVLDGYCKTVDEIVSICLQDNDFYLESGGGVTLSGGECTMQFDACLELLTALKEAGISTALETTGYCESSGFSRLFPLTDLFLFDLKHHDEQKHIEGTGVSNSLCLANMQLALSAGAKVLPRIPVIPGFNDSPADADAFCALLKRLGAAQVQLLPFHQFGESKYEKLGRDYAYKDTPALHAEDLEQYISRFKNSGIAAFI